MGDARQAPAGDFDYEAHGDGYTNRRQPDPRIAAMVHAALGDARTVINVGAGAGSYEPLDRYVVAVEPSAAMRAQRPHHLAPALDATAERLPFDDNSFDAAMAMITIHQWADVDAGLRQLRRVSRGPVAILTFDAEALAELWLNEYVPEVIATERARFPTIDHVAAVLGGEAEVIHVPIPIDCTDGFGEAYYGRPEAFLEADVRAAQSGCAQRPRRDRPRRRQARRRPELRDAGTSATAICAASQRGLARCGWLWGAKATRRRRNASPSGRYEGPRRSVAGSDPATEVRRATS